MVARVGFTTLRVESTTTAVFADGDPEGTPDANTVADDATWREAGPTPDTLPLSR